MQVGPETRLELRSLANLFLVSSVTLALFMAWFFSQALRSDVPASRGVRLGRRAARGPGDHLCARRLHPLRARRLGWLVVCLIPGICLPFAVAYAWVRRMEIEREVLGEDRTPGRQRRGGRRR